MSEPGEIYNGERMWARVNLTLEIVHEPVIVVFRPTTDRTPTEPIPAAVLDMALELCRNGVASDPDRAK